MVDRAIGIIRLTPLISKIINGYSVDHMILKAWKARQDLILPRLRDGDLPDLHKTNKFNIKYKY